MGTLESTVRLTSRRSIRCRRDLWFFVGRICSLIALVAAVAVMIQERDSDLASQLSTSLAVGLVAGLLTVPIIREFGEIYLDLWNSTRALRDLAATDQQTGLLNNRSFVTTVSERLATGRHVALLVGDLDRFKLINDFHGHLVGDEVIARVGEVLRDMFDEIAVLGRMGGEEYAVMLECPFRDPEVAQAHASAMAEEMRRRVATIVVESERGRVTPTVSIGIARSLPGSTFSELYARADKALYVAKAGGRDRVVGEQDIAGLDSERVIAQHQDLYWRPSPAAVVVDDDDAVAWA
ncbi:MAG: GGDEF domain-containing protein [Siculibacillus sp.]|nr:GGDEF domain-containing protein [Siculibacillus sp.]